MYLLGQPLTKKETDSLFDTEWTRKRGDKWEGMSTYARHKTHVYPISGVWEVDGPVETRTFQQGCHLRPFVEGPEQGLEIAKEAWGRKNSVQMSCEYRDKTYWQHQLQEERSAEVEAEMQKLKDELAAYKQVRLTPHSRAHIRAGCHLSP